MVSGLEHDLKDLAHVVPDFLLYFLLVVACLVHHSSTTSQQIFSGGVELLLQEGKFSVIFDEICGCFDLLLVVFVLQLHHVVLVLQKRV